MVTHGEPGRAGAPELLALFDGVARLHPGAREVAVERLQAEPVVDDDGVAVDRQRAREGDHTLVRGGHRALSERREVVAKMHLPVDLPASVEVGAHLGEVREDLRVAGLDEGALPQRVGRRPEGGAPLLLLGLPAEVAVDQEEAVEQRLRGRALRQELRDLGLEEALREADPVAAKVPGPNLGRDAARRGVARLIVGGHRERGARPEVPGEPDERHAGTAVSRRKAREGEGARSHLGGIAAPQAEHDDPAAALRHVLGRRQDVDRRRREVDRDRDRRRGGVGPPERTPIVIARPDLERRRPFPEAERGALDRDGRLEPAPGGCRLRQHYRAGAALRDADLGLRDPPPCRLHDDGERRRQADEAGRRDDDGAHGGRGLTPAEVGRGTAGHEHDEESAEEADLPTGARRHVRHHSTAC